MAGFNEENLTDMLPLYYNRLFPYATFYKWLSYGDPSYFAKREMSFTLASEIYIRFQSFDSQEEFIRALQKERPVKIDVGAIYNVKPKDRRMFTALLPQHKEMVFDIDLTDYDDTRTCCSGANICIMCWKFMTVACKVLDAALREDFGFENLLWVFSGRRGIHCWVCDLEARSLDDAERGTVAEYLQIIKGGVQLKKVHIYGDKIYYALQRALKIAKPYFDMIIKEQDLLGTDERLNNFLKIIDEEVRSDFADAMTAVQTTEDRWKAFVECHKSLSQKHTLPKNCKNLVDEITLQYCYPRLDINVTKGINHLLKAPFCVHPKSGKVSIPFLAKLADKFDPTTVPTLDLLVDEINLYDKETKEQEEKADAMSMDTSTSEINTDAVSKDTSKSEINYSRIKDYKKTSLLKPITTFETFIRTMKKETKSNNDVNEAF